MRIVGIPPPGTPFRVIVRNEHTFDGKLLPAVAQRGATRIRLHPWN